MIVKSPIQTQDLVDDPEGNILGIENIRTKNG